MGVIKKHWQLVIAGTALAVILLAVLLISLWPNISPETVTPIPTPTSTPHSTQTQTPAEQKVSVWIDAPDQVSKGDSFTVTVNISQVTGLVAAQYDIKYNVDVLRVLSVDDGMLGAATVPVDGWNFVPSGVPGAVRVINVVAGTNGINGSGYLAKLNCRAMGSSNQTGSFEFVDGYGTPAGDLLIMDIAEKEIDATWADGTFKIASLPAASDDKDADYAQLPAGIVIAAPIHMPQVTLDRAPAASSCSLPGDANGDGKIDIRDIIRVKLILAGLKPSTACADANGDGIVDSRDIQAILRIILNLKPIMGGGGGGGGGGPVVTPSVSPTPTISPTESPTPTISPTLSPTPSISPTVSPTPTISPTVSATPTISPTLSATPTISPTLSPTPTPTESTTPTLSPTPTVTESPTPTVSPSVSPTPTCTATMGIECPTPTVEFQYHMYGNVTLWVTDETSIWNQTQPMYDGLINISYGEPSGNTRTFTMDADSLSHRAIFFPDMMAGTYMDFYLTLTLGEDSAGTLYIADDVGDVDVFTELRKTAGDPEGDPPVPPEYITTTTIGDLVNDSAGSELSPMNMSGAAAIYIQPYGPPLPPNGSLVLGLFGNMTTNGTGHQIIDEYNPSSAFNGHTINGSGIPFAQSGGPYDYVGTEGKLAMAVGGMEVPGYGALDFHALIDWYLCNATYNLTVDQTSSCCDVNASGYGIVASGSSNTWYDIPCGAGVDVSATFNTSNTWNGWIGDVANASAMNTTVLMNADKTITASCTCTVPTLTVTVSPTVSPTPTLSPSPTITESPTPTESTTPTVSPTATVATPTCTIWPTPTPTSTADTTQVYDRAGGYITQASEMNRPHNSPWDMGTGFSTPTTTEFNNINASDDARWRTAHAMDSGGEGALRYNSQIYKINVSPTGVSWFEVVWEGYGEGEAGHPVNVSVWNESTDAWEILDWQPGYDTQDRELGSRRYELPGATFSNYYNTSNSSNPVEICVRATAGHHYRGAAHIPAGLRTDYIKVITHTAAKPTPVFTADGRKGNWYLYKVRFVGQYANDSTLINENFQFETVDRAEQVAYFNDSVAPTPAPMNGPDGGGMVSKVTNCSHSMWHLPDGLNRYRCVPAPMVTWANNVMQDAEYWTTPSSSIVFAKSNSLPRVLDTAIAAGDSPAINMYNISPTPNVNWSATNTTWDAPYSNGESWVMGEVIDADPRSGTGVTDQWMMNPLTYNVSPDITNFNISSQPLVSGCGKFGGTSDGTQLFNVSQVNYDFNGGGGGGSGNGNNSSKVNFFYNASVENWVRNFNSLRYRGWEDNVIVAYESEDFWRGNLNVSINASRNLSVSLDIMNQLCNAQKFNALLVLLDLTDRTPANSSEYINGHCVYPNVSANTSSWPYYNAIKTTATLNPGDTTTVYWNNSYTLVSGHSYWLWCSGMVYGPWRAW